MKNQRPKELLLGTGGVYLTELSELTEAMLPVFDVVKPKKAK
jgi:hypothetical protein